MNASSREIQNVYLRLLLLHTLAASLIWGINTLFLLDAGLSNAEAFAANAFFTLGLVLFEVPTGVVADTRGRRVSYLLGTLTLAVSTLLYLWMWRIAAPFWAWAFASALLGFGFTFFSGAVEAWLVDALTFTGYIRDGGRLESVLARGQIVEGVAMLGGSVAGGAIAQTTDLGVPYVLRVVVLALTCLVAWRSMHDVGFTPSRGKRPLAEVKRVLQEAVQHGLGNPPVKWVMLEAPFSTGVTIYAFYALQPYLLELYGDPHAYGVAGLAAAIIAGAQILGGLLVPRLGRIFQRRTSVMLLGTLSSALLLALVGLAPQFWVVIIVLVFWGLIFAAVTPVRQAYLNGLIASSDRATVLSFDSLLGSGGGVIIQPTLGRAADAWGYPASYAASAAIQALALPWLWLARRQHAASDDIGGLAEEKVAAASDAPGGGRV
jgi:MFS family permease